MLVQIPFTVSFHCPWLHMTSGLHMPKSDDPKLTEGEFLILCDIKQLMFGFTTTKKTQMLQVFYFQKNVAHIDLLTTVPPKACLAATWFKSNHQRTSRFPLAQERNLWKPEGLHSFTSCLLVSPEALEALFVSELLRFPSVDLSPKDRWKTCNVSSLRYLW